MTKPLRVLILDDDVDLADSLGEFLGLDGHDVTLVHDGLSAIEAFRANEFDIGLFDVKMPGMNGVESFLEIRSFKPDAKVIMMSGYADEGWIARAVAAGAVGLLRKPFDVEDLMARIDESAGAIAA